MPGRKLDTPEFADGYTQVGNRSLFPLANGFLLWEGEHPSWTSKSSFHLRPSFDDRPDRCRSWFLLAGVMISTAAAPSSFNDFRNSSGTDQLAVGYFQGTGTSGCIRVNASAAGLGVQDGSNITLQMVYNGGDGVLYQVKSSEPSFSLNLCRRRVADPGSTVRGSHS